MDLHRAQCYCVAASAWRYIVQIFAKHEPELRMRLLAQRSLRICFAFAVVLSETGLSAQRPDSTAAVRSDTVIHQADTVIAASPRIGGLVSIGSDTEDWLRLQQVIRGIAPEGYLIRSPSRLTEPLRGTSRFQWQLIAPELRTVWNSAIPLSLNDGAIWAGKGINTQVAGGLRARYGRLSLTLAPEIVYSENQHFAQLPPSLQQRRPGRSAFSFPFQADSVSIDLPIRFGDRSYVLVGPGQSSLSLDAAGMTIGIANEDQWWGPGIRNAIVLSNNAGGIPHAFLGTQSPIPSRLGKIEGKWIIGGLTESLFFDTISANDLRSLSGIIMTFQPAFEPNLTLGGARVVYMPAGGRSQILSHSLNALTRWERRAAVGDSTWSPESEQILSLFARWTLPSDGFEAYAEWVRFELPISIRDALSTPNHSQGYTLGTQWVKPVAKHTVRLQGELTYLEKSATAHYRPTTSAYRSRSVPQGYTHRGQAVGAAIGPGSSSQWAAADYFGKRWNLGFSLNRIRWNNDAFYTSKIVNPDLDGRSYHAHDVSLIGGLKAGFQLGTFGVDVGLATEKRYNYLFQNPDVRFGPEGAVDVRNYQFTIRITPVRPRRLADSVHSAGLDLVVDTAAGPSTK